VAGVAARGDDALGVGGGKPVDRADLNQYRFTLSVRSSVFNTLFIHSFMHARTLPEWTGCSVRIGRSSFVASTCGMVLQGPFLALPAAG
jgi:hypothetical protein